MALSSSPYRRVNRKVYNRYFTDVTAAIATLSISGLAFTPGTDWIIKSVRINAMIATVAAGAQYIPMRWALTGAQNQQLDGAVDTLPGLAFDNNTIWGTSNGATSVTPAEWIVPAGTTITLTGRCYSPNPGAAFAAGDTVHFYLTIEYEEIYAIEARGGLSGILG